MLAAPAPQPVLKDKGLHLCDAPYLLRHALGAMYQPSTS